MKNRPDVRSLPKGYSSYHGKVHNKYADRSVKVFEDTRVAMDSVSTGHVVLGKSASSLKEERERLLKAAKITD